MSGDMVELALKPGPVRSAGILQQNRVFLDFFWDLAKPDQEIRLKAVGDLVQYVKTNNKVRRHCHTKVLQHMFLSAKSTQRDVLRDLTFDFLNLLNNGVFETPCCCSTIIVGLIYSSPKLLLIEPRLSCN